MLSGNRLYVNSSLKLLKAILEKDQEVRYRNKIQGFGPNESDFDKEGMRSCGEVSRKIFRERKEEFVKSKLIVPIPSKDKKSNYYGITPLGIAVLFQNTNFENKYQIRQTLRLLKFYFKYFLKKHHKEKSWSNYWLVSTGLLEKLKDGLDEKTLAANLRFVLEGVKIEKNEEKYDVYLSYSLDYLKINFYKYTIENEKNYEVYRGRPVRNSEIENDWFFRDISEFILSAFLYKSLSSYMKQEMFSMSIDEKGKKKVLKIFDEKMLFEANLFNRWLLDLLQSKNSLLNSVKEIFVDLENTKR